MSVMKWSTRAEVDDFDVSHCFGFGGSWCIPPTMMTMMPSYYYSTIC